MSNAGSHLSSKSSDYSSLGAALDYILKRHSLNFECCLPAIVEDYDRERNVAAVRPLIMITTLAQETAKTNTIRRHLIRDMPVISIGAGGFHINFPIKVGDLGWIHASDRDIQSFLRTLSEAAALTEITHKFSQGIFVPDVFRNYTINSEDADCFVLQSTDASARISIGVDRIKVTHPTKVVIDSPETNITGHVTIDGDAEISGISFVNHTHGGVITGGSSTTKPK